MKRNLFWVVMLSLSLSACGPKATPTINAADVQASAVAAANTMVALTQAAIPTATPIPPTDTPSPTPLATATSVALPTLPFPVATPTPLSSPGGDPCQAPLAKDAAGPNLKSVLIVNDTKYPLILSLYLEKTPFGECGYKGYNIEARGSTLDTNLKVGCYFAGAFVGNHSKSFGSFCMMDDNHKWEIHVKEEVIVLIGP